MGATGRLVNHDPASRGYAAPPAPVKQISWLHRLGPVLNQASLNGCVGWTGADWLNAALALRNRRRYNAAKPDPRYSDYLRDRDGQSLYEASTRNDPFDWTYPPTDGGSSALGLGKALKAAGVIDSYLWTFSFAQLLAHGVRQPLCIGTVWTDAMSDPDSKGIIRAGTDAAVKAAADDGMGHEYLLRGVNWPRKLARIRNHWTPDWGIKGDALIPLDDLERLIIKYRGDVMVPTLAVA